MPRPHAFRADCSPTDGRRGFPALPGGRGCGTSSGRRPCRSPSRRRVSSPPGPCPGEDDVDLLEHRSSTASSTTAAAADHVHSRAPQVVVRSRCATRKGRRVSLVRRAFDPPHSARRAWMASLMVRTAWSTLRTVVSGESCSDRWMNAVEPRPGGVVAASVVVDLSSVCGGPFGEGGDGVQQRCAEWGECVVDARGNAGVHGPG